MQLDNSLPFIEYSQAESAAVMGWCRAHDWCEAVSVTLDGLILDSHFEGSGLLFNTLEDLRAWAGY